MPETKIFTLEELQEMGVSPEQPKTQEVPPDVGSMEQSTGAQRVAEIFADAERGGAVDVQPEDMSADFVGNVAAVIDSLVPKAKRSEQLNTLVGDLEQIEAEIRAGEDVDLSEEIPFVERAIALTFGESNPVNMQEQVADVVSLAEARRAQKEAAEMLATEAHERAVGDAWAMEDVADAFSSGDVFLDVQGHGAKIKELFGAGVDTATKMDRLHRLREAIQGKTGYDHLRETIDGELRRGSSTRTGDQLVNAMNTELSRRQRDLKRGAA